MSIRQCFCVCPASNAHGWLVYKTARKALRNSIKFMSLLIWSVIYLATIHSPGDMRRIRGNIGRKPRIYFFIIIIRTLFSLFLRIKSIFKIQNKNIKFLKTPNISRKDKLVNTNLLRGSETIYTFSILSRKNGIKVCTQICPNLK